MWAVVALLSVTVRFSYSATENYTTEPTTTFDPLVLVDQLEKDCEIFIKNPEPLHGDTFLNSIALYGKLVPMLGLLIMLNESNRALKVYKQLENLGGPSPVRLTITEDVEVQMRRKFEWLHQDVRKMKALIKHLTKKWNHLVCWLRYNNTFVFNETLLLNSAAIDDCKRSKCDFVMD